MGTSEASTGCYVDVNSPAGHVSAQTMPRRRSVLRAALAVRVAPADKRATFADGVKSISCGELQKDRDAGSAASLSLAAKGPDDQDRFLFAKRRQMSDPCHDRFVLKRGIQIRSHETDVVIGSVPDLHVGTRMDILVWGIFAGSSHA